MNINGTLGAINDNINKANAIAGMGVTDNTNKKSDDGDNSDDASSQFY